MQDQNRFKTEVCNLEGLGDRKYIIPSYQRPYVWGDEQIKKLLADFAMACDNEEERYFMGTVIVSEQQKDMLELIDGQQRFTTLWLFALVCKKIRLKHKPNGEPWPIESFPKVGGELRLNFSIREQISKYLQKLLENPGAAAIEAEVESDEYLLPIARAMSTIEGHLNELQGLEGTCYIQKFSEYNTQIWLSPFLIKLVAKCGMSEDEALRTLEWIDNLLSLSEKESKATTTYEVMKLNTGCEQTPFQKLNLEEELKEPKGTGFKHYWFQKLEYVLWKGWEDRESPKFKQYRITSKNSVEHIFPQNHEFGSQIEEDEKKLLNSFGNLGLLSVSQNSSYSNQDVEKKRVDFKKKATYDSLKLAKIYGSPNWNADAIKKHQEDMIEKLTAHYNQIFTIKN